MRVSVRVYTDLADPADPESGTLASERTGLYPNEGWYTIELDEPVPVDEGGGGSGDSGAAGAGDGAGGSAGDPGGSGEPGGSKDGADVSPLAGTGDAAHPFAVLAATACAAAAAMGAAAFARIAPEPAGDRTRRSGRRIGLADDDSAEQAESRGRR